MREKSIKIRKTENEKRGNRERNTESEKQREHREP